MTWILVSLLHTEAFPPTLLLLQHHVTGCRRRAQRSAALRTLLLGCAWAACTATGNAVRFHLTTICMNIPHVDTMPQLWHVAWQ